MRRKKICLLSSVCLMFLFVLPGCWGMTEGGRLADKSRRNLILATTTSTQDTGLLDEIIPQFEKKYNIRVKTIAVGTGEALALGGRGEADVLLVHSREAEDKFMEDGYGKVRKDVMYNDFVILGPLSDPAKTKGENPEDAFARIATAKVIFISRGDSSGTHKKEMEIWRKTNMITPPPKRALGPKWYLESGQGMGETLRIANEKQAYTLADRGTYLAQKKNLNLKILVEKDKILFNSYGVIVVSPKRFPKVNYEDAARFADWITSYNVQKIIEDFGKEKYGQPLFIPNSDEWEARTKK